MIQEPVGHCVLYSIPFFTEKYLDFKYKLNKKASIRWIGGKRGGFLSFCREIPYTIQIKNHWWLRKIYSSPYKKRV